MADPVEWFRTNCPFAHLYFPNASCARIQQLFESCVH
ncbi:unnamed protein product [Gongylonema pulchrum]|uniref:CX9C domain-containing protein n=1 Tax=Gongylonema pulchrum TaxID=637853 RepID=A0A183CU85_9BILA|nr:unnamed protein product [Gongylonema pulchrum]